VQIIEHKLLLFTQLRIAGSVFFFDAPVVQFSLPLKEISL
jgi:hypothetical protein